MLDIREDDLTHQAVQSLIALHLGGMRASSPPGFSFALDLSGLQAPGIVVYSAWEGDSLAGVGALKRLADGTGEIKSMRTHPDHLRKGIGAALLEHIIGVARDAGLTRLSIETGVGGDFNAALALYRRRGFVGGAPFGDYRATDFNQFLHFDL